VTLVMSVLVVLISVLVPKPYSDPGAVPLVHDLEGGVGSVAAVDQESPRPDLLTLARGAVPVALGGAGAQQGADMTHAVRFIDGDPRGSTVMNRATDETDLEVVYALPAQTVFDRFAVPEVLETPSPSQTFVRQVEVLGASGGPEGPWTLLASGTLSTHPSRGMVTELDLVDQRPVSWIKLRLAGGIEMLRDQMFLEFGEIIGNGTQEPAPLSDRFSGSWWDRGVRVTLVQNGAVVTGCYDDGSPLEGTVSGNILKATGIGAGDGVVSHFILGITDEGEVRGVRSTNGAPFALYAGAAAQGRRVECPEAPQPRLGCGSVIQGFKFDFDSAVLRPESDLILAMLAEGLSHERGTAISIEGHTSAEGDESYNQGLSERRAQAVVDGLVALGVDPARLSAAGFGEGRPIASNDDENGRAMNRRVEVVCSGG